jgi:hypothetical protein
VNSLLKSFKITLVWEVKTLPNLLGGITVGNLEIIHAKRGD